MKIRKLVLSIIWLSLLLISSLRVGYGPDYYSYEEVFYLVNDDPSVELCCSVLPDIEVSFRLITSVVRSWNFDYRGYLFIISLSILFPLYYLFIRYPNYVATYTYICFFYLAWAFSGIRQGMSLTLVFAAFYLMASNRKKAWQFMLLVFAVLLHYSAIISILLYPALTRTYSIKKYTMFLFVILSLSLLLSESVFDVMMPPFLEGRILYYLQNDSNVSVVKMLWRVSIFLLVVVLYLRFGAKLNDFERRILQTFLLFLPIYILFSKVEIVAAQTSIYPFFLYSFVTPILYDGIKSKFSKSMFIGFILFSGMIYFYSMLNFTISASQENSGRSERIEYLRI